MNPTPFIEWTVSVGNILTLLGFFGTVVVFGVRMGSRLDYLEKDMAALAAETKQMAALMTQIAVQTTRLDMLQETQMMQGKRVDDVIGRVDGLIRRENHKPRSA